MADLTDPRVLREAAAEYRARAESREPGFERATLAGLARNLEDAAEAIEDMTPEMRADLAAMMASLRPN